MKLSVKNISTQNFFKEESSFVFDRSFQRYATKFGRSLPIEISKFNFELGPPLPLRPNSLHKFYPGEILLELKEHIFRRRLNNSKVFHR